MQHFNWLANIMGFRTAPAAVAEAITLGDRNRQLRVMLDPSLPDDAYQQLFELDLSVVPTGTLTWDHHARSWRVR